MNIKELSFKDQIKLAIKELSKVPTSHILKKSTELEVNLKTLASSTARIISLAEHRKIRLSCNLLKEVLRDRNGGIRPETPIYISKPRQSEKTRTKALKII